MKNILIIAAENSAENYALQVVKEFNTHNHPQSKTPVHFFGVGGDRLEQNGVEIIVHNRELAVVGIVEVLSSILKLKRCMNLLFREAVKRKADAILLIDYPDFNLRMAQRFKAAGFRVYYYISPTVWAWRYSRVNLIKKYVDHLFIIFPFEIPIFEKEGIPFTYTGHPMVPMIRVTEDRPTYRARHGIKDDEVVITLLPGSRQSEIMYLLPTMLATVKQLAPHYKLRVFLLKADGIDPQLPQNHINSYINSGNPAVTMVDQAGRYDLINASDAVLTTCGTSNLEIAMIGVPFTAVYRVNRFSYFLGKRFVKIKLYSIVNILSGGEVVRELIQDDFTAPNAAAELRRIIDHPDVGTRMKARFDRVREQLSQGLNPPDIIRRKITADLEAQK